MQRFAQSLLLGLNQRGLSAELVSAPVWLGRAGASSLQGFGKWLAYLDKYLIFPLLLRLKIARVRAPHLGGPLVVHICDHSNAMYSSAVPRVPLVISCHDLLAVRGALGEDTDCPASPAGKWLQRWILHGLSRGSAIACISSATQADADRLVKLVRHGARTHHVPMGLNYPYRPLPEAEIRERLSQVASLAAPFILHVGSNLRRKNREGVLRIFAGIAPRWKGQLVFAGQPLSRELRVLADTLQISARIVEVRKPDNDLLEALYGGAMALLFPSRFEGFGWPITEAQACGCPVVCSNAGPLPEVAGGAALLRDVDDEAGLAADIMSLTDPVERERWARKGLENARNFSTERMIENFVYLYRQVAAAPAQ